MIKPLARLGANVTGIDACRENIIAAQLRVESELEKTKGSASFYQRIRYLNCIIYILIYLLHVFNLANCKGTNTHLSRARYLK